MDAVSFIVFSLAYHTPRTATWASPHWQGGTCALERHLPQKQTQQQSVGKFIRAGSDDIGRQSEGQRPDRYQRGASPHVTGTTNQ
jgi:hypothetical protein